MGDLRSELGKQARTRLLDAGLKKTGLDHVIIIIIIKKLKSQNSFQVYKYFHLFKAT